MSRVYIDELADLAPSLARGEDDGVRRLMECHRDIGWRCHDLGHARFEEGSEHFLAYTFEAVTGRTIMHGELVTMGVLAMSAIRATTRTAPGRSPTPRRCAHRCPTSASRGTRWRRPCVACPRSWRTGPVVVRRTSSPSANASWRSCARPFASRADAVHGALGGELIA